MYHFKHDYIRFFVFLFCSPEQLHVTLLTGIIKVMSANIVNVGKYLWYLVTTGLLIIIISVDKFFFFFKSAYVPTVQGLKKKCAKWFVQAENNWLPWSLRSYSFILEGSFHIKLTNSM